MGFEILEKSPQVAPLLVRLYDTHNLYSLAGDKDSDDARLELATIMVDLLKIKLSDTESELITDVLLALMKQAESDLKRALAENISTQDGVPLRMVLALANDEISIAEPVLRNSPVLDDMDLIYILQAKGIAHGRAIARRAGMSATLINMLIDTKDFEVAVNLSANNGIALTNHAFDVLANMAKQNEDVAAPLLHRSDLPQDIAAKIYSFVSAELKKEINARFGNQADAAGAMLDHIATEICESPDRVNDGFETILARAHILQRRGELNIAGMIAALRRGQHATFLAQFATYCALPTETVRNMLRQENGKGLAIACRAYDFSKADYVGIYLLTERMRGHIKRVVTHAELSRLMDMFDSIQPDEARRAIGSTRH
jgi:uncharacterized protein (DUF2336 family)